MPAPVRAMVADIDSGQVLGASRQLTLIGDAMLRLAEEATSQPAALPSLLRELVEHFVTTRGASSQAIINGLHLMADAGLAADADPDEIPVRLIDGVHAFRKTLAQWLEDLKVHGTALLPTTSTVLAYDYSSSVAALIRAAVAAGADLTVVIPEARSLNGGQRYLPELTQLPIRIRLIPDAAICWALRDTDCILVGAETMSLEGGCYNTIGTELLAHLAKQAGTPFHVVSILLKVDRSTEGNALRPIPLRDFPQEIDRDGAPNSPADMDFSFPDLDYTPPSRVTSIATERGILTPEEFRQVAAIPAPLLQQHEPSG